MKKLLMLSILISLPLFANIDAQIEAIQKASVSERFILMNDFKKEIVQMQEEERLHAITKLQSITQSKHANKAMKEVRTHIKQRRTKEYRHTKIRHHKEREHVEHTQEGVENETEDSVEDEVENETEDSVEDEIENETEDSVEDEVENETEDSVEDEIENETEEHIEHEIEDHEEDEHDDD